MINSRFINFSLVLSRMFGVSIISICDDFVHGNCPRGVMCDIASLAVNEGYTVEFLPLDIKDFKVSFTVCFS